MLPDVKAEVSKHECKVPDVKAEGANMNVCYRMLRQKGTNTDKSRKKKIGVALDQIVMANPE